MALRINNGQDDDGRGKNLDPHNGAVAEAAMEAAAATTPNVYQICRNNIRAVSIESIDEYRCM
jgi:hypothetical protein